MKTNTLAILYGTAVIGGLLLVATFIVFRIYGDVQVCTKFYPEMNTFACYMSSKTVRVPQ